MKTTKSKKSNEAKAAPASVRPSSVSKAGTLPKINFAVRLQNRALPTEKLLASLESKLPEAFRLAEVVGKWVFVQFGDIPAAEIRRQLAELGFHWNNMRQSWQHPCGTYRDTRANYDPRQRYGSYFAADRKAA